MKLLTFKTLDFIFMVVLFNTVIVLIYDNETDSIEIMTKRINYERYIKVRKLIYA